MKKSKDRSYWLNLQKEDSVQKILMGVSLLFLFSFCLYPFINLFYKVLFPQGVLSLEYIESVLKHNGVLRAFKNTFFVSISIALFSILLAVPLGYLLARTNLPFSGKLRSFFVLPYTIPPYIGAMAWIYLANPSTGLLNRAFGSSWIDIYSYFGLIWVETTFFYTFVLLAVLTSLDRMDSSLEEAARLSGASPCRVFWSITLPLMRPAVVSGGILVALAAAASFGVPALIGNPAKIYLVTTQIYTFQKMGSMRGLFQAGALSILLLLLSLGFLFLNHWLSKGEQFKIVSGKASRPSLVELSSWRGPILIFLILLFLVLFVVPLAGILITALSQIQGDLSWANFGLANFHRVFFEMTETSRALGNSFFLATMAATVATMLAIILSFIQLKTRLKGRQFVEISASLPYSIPGTVVAFALILAFSGRLFGIGPSLYNTLTLLWLAYLIKFLSLAMKTIGDGLGQIDDSLAEAARVSGASWYRTFAIIWIPLLKPSIVASWFLIFMPAFGELTITILLSGPGMETLGTLIFQLQEYADPSGGSSAVLALVVVFMVIIINLSVKKLSGGRYGL